MVFYSECLVRTLFKTPLIITGANSGLLGSVHLKHLAPAPSLLSPWRDQEGKYSMPQQDNSKCQTRSQRQGRKGSGPRQPTLGRAPTIGGEPATKTRDARTPFAHLFRHEARSSSSPTSHGRAILVVWIGSTRPCHHVGFGAMAGANPR